MDNQSIQHTWWNCTYNIVLIPKYRKKVMYGSNKKDIMEIIKKLCEMKGKGALMFYDRHSEMRTKWRDRYLWARDIIWRQWEM